MSDEWECFSDPAYYDMWCVRQVGSRTFGEGFHLVNGDEAKMLCRFLNTRPADRIEAQAAEIERLREALRPFATAAEKGRAVYIGVAMAMKEKPELFPYRFCLSLHGQPAYQ